MKEPVFTWNLILTLIAIPLFLYAVNLFIRRAFDKYSEGWEKYREEKDKNLTEWRDMIAKKLTSFESAIMNISHKVPVLITKEQCDDMHKEIYGTLDEHGNRITALETQCKMKERGDGHG